MVHPEHQPYWFKVGGGCGLLGLAMIALAGALASSTAHLNPVGLLMIIAYAAFGTAGVCFALGIRQVRFPFAVTGGGGPGRLGDNGIAAALEASEELKDEIEIGARLLGSLQRPQPGERVQAVTEAAGTVDVKRLNGRTIWFAVSTPGIAGFFIQGNWRTKSGCATVRAGGRWTSPSLRYSALIGS